MRLIDADALKAKWYEINDIDETDRGVRFVGYNEIARFIDHAPTIEPKWITDRKPTEEGTYMVTLDAFGHHRYIELMCYGKPLMPNREVKGMCWYESDDEWGDVVYNDEDILAWLPLPTPYSERKE